jgi:alkanesulfonate monooxygenase SsuD/methylene tetrahydromethanopterin reductase-like flavin-dependent oxidoreductase (luciferase family)
VTSTRLADAANYGFDELMEHSSRYDRMEEFIDVCKALWDSVEPDAFKWDRETRIVGDPGKVHAINHVGKYFKVKGPLNTVPSPQGRPVLIQAGGSPRGIRASAYFADYVFGVPKPLKLQVQHRHDLDAALLAQGRDPAGVGILWDILLVVAETEHEAKARRESLLTAIPREAAGAFISHQTSYDFSTLPARFTPGEINERVAANQASPVGLVHSLANEIGERTEISREEFFEYGLRVATGYNSTIAGTATQVADHLEGQFEATGNRGGFMVAHPQGERISLSNDNSASKLRGNFLELQRWQASSFVEKR